MNRHFHLGISNPNETGRIRKLGVARSVAFVVAGILGMANQAHAQLPPGQKGCKNFQLGVNIEGAQIVNKVFYDKTGTEVVRIIMAGRGSTNTFINTETKASLTIRPSGSVAKITNNPDGSQTFTTTGHYAIIWYTTDVDGNNGQPIGPSAILYIGRTVSTVDRDGNFTLEGTTGKQIDICAALSPTP